MVKTVEQEHISGSMCREVRQDAGSGLILLLILSLSWIHEAGKDKSSSECEIMHGQMCQKYFQSYSKCYVNTKDAWFEKYFQRKSWWVDKWFLGREPECKRDSFWSRWSTMASFWIKVVKVLFGPSWTKSPTGPWMSLELQSSVVLQVIARYRDRDTWIHGCQPSTGHWAQHRDTHYFQESARECAQADPGGSKSARKNLKILPIPIQYEGRGWGNMGDDTL